LEVAVRTVTRIVVSTLFLAAIGPLPVGAVESDPELGDPVYLFVDESSAEPVLGIEPDSIAVNTWSRSQVVSFFNAEYTPALSVAMGWTGNAATCNAGTTSQAYLDATFQMINFYRGMTGLPDVTNATTYNAASQQAALIMSVNGALNHNPPSSWTCWTSAGASAAGSSNLALGAAGPGAIVLYMTDPGSGNYFVGHRRYVLYPRRNQFGSGSVGESTPQANALYVFTTTVARPATPTKVAWPPEGYVPYQVVYARWSMALNTSSTVSFASANVTMTEGGSPVSLSVVSRVDNGYGDNTIVWEPSGLSFSPGMQDRTFTVTVSGISVSGSPQTVVYDVVVMDPAVNNDLIFEDDFESGGTGSWTATVG
jgi:uncharacterized protein YkwD